MTRARNRISAAVIVAALGIGVGACGGGDGDAAAGGSGEELAGDITIDGSSTVFPFAEAAAEFFNEEHPDVRITVGASGTGGGFEKFCAGETDISNASRPIKEDEEAPLCEDNGVEYTETQVVNDGIAVVTNPGLAVDCLTTGQLERIWTRGSEVQALSDLDPALPDTPLSLYGPGTDSGTFDFFTDEINGEEGVTREDYEASEDDNQLVTGVAGDAGGMGYFGYSYYDANQDQLNLVGVDAGDGCVKPSLESIQDGSYEPLARPIFMYPSAAAMREPHVRAFMEFVLANQQQIAEAAQMVPMTDEQIADAQRALGL